MTGSLDGVTVTGSVAVALSAGFSPSVTRTDSSVEAAVVPSSTSAAVKRSWFSQAWASAGRPTKRRPSGSVLTRPPWPPPGSSRAPSALLPSVTSTVTWGLLRASSDSVQPDSVAVLAPDGFRALGSTTSSGAAVVETLGAASSAAVPASQSGAKGRAVSTGPVAASSTQLPPASAEPEASVEAATSACVRRAMRSSSSRPSSPLPLEQP